MENQIRTKLQLYGQEAKLIKEINQYLIDQEYHSITFQKEKDHWILRFQNQNRTLCTIVSTQKKKALQCLKQCIKYIYQDIKYTTASIIVDADKPYTAVLKRNEHICENIEEKEEMLFRKKMKQWVVDQNFVMSPIRILSSAKEMSPTKQLAIMHYLLKGDYLLIYSKDNEMKSEICEEENETNQDFEINIQALQEQEHPKLIEKIKTEKMQIILRLDVDFQIVAILINEFHEPIEIATADTIIATLKELEKKIKMSRVRKKEEK